MKCDNCETQAVYCVNDPGTNAVYYCSSCLPTWQHERAKNGQFPLPVTEEAKTEKSKKASSSDEDK
jgi:hypothetical protein